MRELALKEESLREVSEQLESQKRETSETLQLLKENSEVQFETQLSALREKHL